MQLDKNAIDKLLALDDRALWSVIKMIAAQSSITLTDQIGQSEMAALRGALGAATDADIAQAAQLLSRYKEQGGDR